MESLPKTSSAAEAFAALAQRGWTLSEDNGALICTHQDGSKFVVKNAFIKTAGFDREQLLDRIASAVVDSVGPNRRRQ